MHEPSTASLRLSRMSGTRVAAQQPDPAVLQQHAREGERALAEKRYADAEKAYEALRQLSPGDRRSPRAARLHLLPAGQVQPRPFRALREALRLKPGLPNVDTLLAMSLSELGRYEEALPALEKAFPRNSADPALRAHGRPPSAAHLHRPGARSRRRRRRAPAVAALSRRSRSAVSRRPAVRELRLPADDEARARSRPIRCGCIRRRAKRTRARACYDAAIREYRQVLAACAAPPGIHFRIGRVLLSRAGEARPRCGAPAAGGPASSSRRSSPSIPTNANAAYEIGEMHRKAGQLDAGARRPSRRAVTHYPEFEEALVGLGRTLIAPGDAGARRCRTCSSAIAQNASRRGRLLPARAGPPRARQTAAAGEGARRVRRGCAMRRAPSAAALEPSRPARTSRSRR